VPATNSAANGGHQARKEGRLISPRREFDVDDLYSQYRIPYTRRVGKREGAKGRAQTFQRRGSEGHRGHRGHSGDLDCVAPQPGAPVVAFRPRMLPSDPRIGAVVIPLSTRRFHSPSMSR
jgi:hypothetical protein